MDNIGNDPSNRRNLRSTSKSTSNTPNAGENDLRNLIKKKNPEETKLREEIESLKEQLANQQEHINSDRIRVLEDTITQLNGDLEFMINSYADLEDKMDLAIEDLKDKAVNSCKIRIITKKRKASDSDNNSDYENDDDADEPRRSKRLKKLPDLDYNKLNDLENMDIYDADEEDYNEEIVSEGGSGDDENSKKKRKCSKTTPYRDDIELDIAKILSSDDDGNDPDDGNDKENEEDYDDISGTINSIKDSEQMELVKMAAELEKHILINRVRKILPKDYCKFALKQSTNTCGKRKHKKQIEREFGDIEKFLDTSGIYDKDHMTDYFMRLNTEQKREYQDKVNQINANKKELVPDYFRILNSDIPDVSKNLIIQRLKTHENDVHQSSKFTNWLNSLFEIPWNKYSTIPISINDSSSKISSYLSAARDNMDKAVYGQEQTKDHIIQILTKMISNPEKCSNVFAIYGPAGTGKTTIIKEGLSKALGIPFSFVSLGGASESAYLTGHDYTWEGSKHGEIVQRLKIAGSMNPVFYFDELDKISTSNKGDEVSNLLVHLTDPSQNSLFYDKYFTGIPIDLSKCIFVFSFNDINKVNKILLDRMEPILVEGFTLKEKRVIAKDYTLPRLYKEYNVDPKNVVFDDNVIDYIINYKDNHNKEKGVRSMNRRIENIISKLNILLLTKKKINGVHKNLSKLEGLNNISFPIKVNNDMVNKLVNKIKEDRPPMGMYC